MLEIVLPGYLYVGAVVGLIVKMMVKYLIVLNDKTNTLLSLKKKKLLFSGFHGIQQKVVRLKMT